MCKSIFYVAIIFTCAISSGQTVSFEIKPIFDLIEGRNIENVIILDGNKEEIRSKLIEVWGEPENDNYGSLRWSDLSIPGIGDKVKSKLYWGYTTTIGEMKRLD